MIRLRGENETEVTEHDINLVINYILSEIVAIGLLSERSSQILERDLITQAD